MGGVWRSRARRAAWSSVWVGLLLASACASDLAVVEGGFRHPRQGWTLGVPQGPGPPWQRIDVDGALLAFRRPGPAHISLQARCGKPVAEPAIMARHLTIGLGGPRLRQAGPGSVDGRDAWIQIFETREDSVAVRVKTVTLVTGDCTLDWVLATAGDFAEDERAFDSWWQTFQLPAEAVGGRGDER